MTYISKYASKPEALSESYHMALNEFCSRVPARLPAKSAVQRLFARMAADRDISAQEAVHLLLGEPLVGCSRSFVNLNAQTDAPHALWNTLELDEDDPAFEASFFARYQTRPDHLVHLNAIDFCKSFNVTQRSFFGPLIATQICRLILYSWLIQDMVILFSNVAGKMLSYMHGHVQRRSQPEMTASSNTGLLHNSDCINHLERLTNFLSLPLKPSFPHIWPQVVFHILSIKNNCR